ETAGEPPARGFKAQIVPVQIDLGELVAVHASTHPGPRPFNAVRLQHERFPGGSDRALVLALRRAEYEALGAEEPSSLQQVGEPSLRFERNTAGFGVLRVVGRNDDLMRVPEHMTVLDLQHLAEPGGGLQGADDPITHLSARECVLGAIELVGSFKQPALLVRRDPTITLGLDLCPDLYAETMERRSSEDGRRPAPN